MIEREMNMNAKSFAKIILKEILVKKSHNFLQNKLRVRGGEANTGYGTSVYFLLVSPWWTPSEEYSSEEAHHHSFLSPSFLHHLSSFVIMSTQKH